MIQPQPLHSRQTPLPAQQPDIQRDNPQPMTDSSPRLQQPMPMVQGASQASPPQALPGSFPPAAPVANFPKSGFIQSPQAKDSPAPQASGNDSDPEMGKRDSQKKPPQKNPFDTPPSVISPEAIEYNPNGQRQSMIEQQIIENVETGFEGPGLFPGTEPGGEDHAGGSH